MKEESKQLQYDEITAKSSSGMVALLLNLLLMVGSIVLFVLSINGLDADRGNTGVWVALIIVSVAYFGVVGPILFAGLKVLSPNEALVLTFFGKYYGTLKGPGFYFVNPFTSAINPAADTTTMNVSTGETKSSSQPGQANTQQIVRARTKKISLKALTLSNDKQKINDQLGNPIVIGIVVIWKVTNTAKAVFNVDNYKEFLSIQCDSALRNIVRLYPYDATGDNNEKSLRGSSDEISQKIKEEIQKKVEVAGLEIAEARITHLSYAQEIAAAMLQRQQASAIVDARQMIVDGAVGMVEMALAKLSEREIVHLDEERKAAMVSNLLVVLCANKDAQPIVNSGSLY